MLFFQVIGLNFSLLLVLFLVGFFPTKLLEKKYQHFPFALFGFVALLMGYFLFQSLVALVKTKGNTVQWVNFLPVLYLFFLPDKTQGLSARRIDFVFLAWIVFVLIISAAYFVSSYSSDFQTIDKYPFIDIVSYASTAIGMGFSGQETVFADTAIFYPGRFPFGLYHFTELWTLVGIKQLMGIPELFSISFLIPVFYFGLIASGIYAWLVTSNQWKWHWFLVIPALIFANGKLVLSNDYFLYNILDLCGLKISLLIPILLFLFILKDNQQILLTFSLWLLQANILYAVGLGIFFLSIMVAEGPAKFFISKSWSFWGVACITILVYGLCLSQGVSQGPEFAFQPVSAFDGFLKGLIYFREGVFNLGFQYWFPFWVIAAILVNRLHFLLLIPFAAAKIFAKALAIFIPSQFIVLPEILIFIFAYFFIRPLLSPNIKKGTALIMGLIFLLSLVAGWGNALTGFMDFEQIYTLIAAASFFLFSLFLFTQYGHSPGGVFPQIQSPLIVATSIFICAYTFRFQRVIPFSTQFFNQVEKTISNTSHSRFAAYFSVKAFYPFPLHVQAGFPLLFSYTDVLSTPVTQMESNNWQGTERESQVRNFPFMIFASKDAQFQKDGNISSLQIRFLQHFHIRYLWVDKQYQSKVLDLLKPAVIKKIQAPGMEPDFWIINPELISKS